jgi:serine/threonine protein kinase
MAPEVALGKKYTGYCDIYSFAITFWEMLTYERPFEKYPTIRQMKKNVWDSTSQARPNLDNDLIPDPLRIMLRKAWSENVVLRPKLLEVKNFLRNEMRGQPMPKKIVEWMSTDNECPFCQKNRTNLVKGELRLLQEPIETTPASFFIR